MLSQQERMLVSSIRRLNVFFLSADGMRQERRHDSNPAPNEPFPRGVTARDDTLARDHGRGCRRCEGEGIDGARRDGG